MKTTTKNTSKSRVSAVASLAFVGATMLLASGCMTSPYHGQCIHSFNTPVAIDGFVLNPRELVQIQYFNYATHQWNSLVTVNAKGPADSLQWSSKTWYPWDAGKRKVPRNGWRKIKDFTYQARLRAVTETGNAYTFDEDFWNCFNGNMNMGELWNECGHDTELAIFMTP